MENTGIHQFSLSDAKGVAHAYVVTEHPAGEGMAIMFALLGMGAPAVMGLAGSALRSEDMLRAILDALSGSADAKLDTSDLAKLVSGLDLASVGQELGKALGTGLAPGLTRQVLSRTYRDGKPLASGLDMAYQANYAELLMAVWKVCGINHFFPVPSISPSSPNVPTSQQVGSLSVA